MDVNIITYLACICFIFVFGRIFILPIKKILKLIFNSVLGGISIYVINLIGSTFGFHIGLNFFTSILIRIIGITGSSLFNHRKIINRILTGKRDLKIKKSNVENITLEIFSKIIFIRIQSLFQQLL